MFNSTGYSLSDIAAVTGRNGGNGGFGDDGAWWIILLFLFAGGWGNGNGFGGGGREDIAYNFDMNGLENGVRGIQQGLCDGFYAQNSTLCQGFNGVNTALLQGFNGIQAQLATDALADQKCCCETQNLISGKFCELNYNLASQACDTRRAIADSTRDIIDNQNGNTRAILDFLTQDKIADLQAENQSLKMAASQANQNLALGAMMDANTAEILRRVAPTPVPAYPACPPYGHGYGYGGFGKDGGCGCSC